MRNARFSPPQCSRITRSSHVNAILLDTCRAHPLNIRITQGDCGKELAYSTEQPLCSLSARKRLPSGSRSGNEIHVSPYSLSACLLHL